MTVATPHENFDPSIGRAANPRLASCANSELAVGAEVFPVGPVTIGRRLPQVPDVTVATPHENLDPSIRRVPNPDVRRSQRNGQEGLHRVRNYALADAAKGVIKRAHAAVEGGPVTAAMEITRTFIGADVASRFWVGLGVAV